MKDKLKILIVEPNKPPVISEIEDDYKAMQNVVGGFVGVSRINTTKYTVRNCGQLAK